MTAVEDEKNGIQSVINEIASEVDGDESTVEETTEEQSLNGDQNTGDDSNQGDGSDAGDNENDTNETKDNKAFAAMRVANKKLEEQLDALKAELESLKGNTDDSNDDNANEDDATKIKDTDSDEVKALKAELAKMRETQNELVSDKTERQLQQERNKLLGELRAVRTKYTLNEQQLLKFADDAEKQGFILGQSPLSVDQIYTLVYHNDIVAAAAKRVEEQTNEDVAPTSGPGATGKTGGKTSASPKAMVAEIAKELGLG